MKYQLRFFAATMLLSVSFVAHPMENVIPVLSEFALWHAGMRSQAFAKQLGNWTVEEQFGLRAKTPLVSVLKQDLKFAYTTVLSSYFSYFYPTLGNAPSRVFNSQGRAVPVLTAYSIRSIGSSSSLAVLPEDCTTPPPTSLTPAPGASIEPSTVNVLRPVAEGFEIPARPLTAHDSTAALFKAGAKYVAMNEFIEYLNKVGKQWNKLHPLVSPDVAVKHNDTNAVLPDMLDGDGSCDLLSPSLPIVWFHWIESKAAECAPSIFKSVWEDKGLAMLVAIYMATAYSMTRFTMVASSVTREMVLINPARQQNPAYQMFANEPFKQIFDTSVGVLVSFYLKDKVTMPWLREQAGHFGINVTRAEALLDAAYMAGIKSTFALDALTGTWDAKGNSFIKSPAAFLFGFIAFDRFIAPVMTRMFSHMMYVVQLGMVYHAYYRALQIKLAQRG